MWEDVGGFVGCLRQIYVDKLPATVKRLSGFTLNSVRLQYMYIDSYTWDVVSLITVRMVQEVELLVVPSPLSATLRPASMAPVLRTGLSCLVYSAAQQQKVHLSLTPSFLRGFWAPIANPVATTISISQS